MSNPSAPRTAPALAAGAGSILLAGLIIGIIFDNIAVGIAIGLALGGSFALDRPKKVAVAAHDDGKD